MAGAERDAIAVVRVYHTGMTADVDPQTDPRVPTTPRLREVEARALVLDARLTVARTLAIAEVAEMTALDAKLSEQWREIAGVARWLSLALASYSAIHLKPPPRVVKGWRGWLIRMLTPHT